MNSQDLTANNHQPQPEVIILDEFASIEKSLKGHHNAPVILEKLQEYQSQVLRADRSKKD